jgi:hypothetical protein
MIEFVTVNEMPFPCVFQDLESTEFTLQIAGPQNLNKTERKATMYCLILRGRRTVCVF